MNTYRKLQHIRNPRCVNLTCTRPVFLFMEYLGNAHSERCCTAAVGHNISWDDEDDESRSKISLPFSTSNQFITMPSDYFT